MVYAPYRTFVEVAIVQDSKIPETYVSAFLY